jgi:hypothetical protein
MRARDSETFDGYRPIQKTFHVSEQRRIVVMVAIASVTVFPRSDKEIYFYDWNSFCGFLSLSKIILLATITLTRLSEEEVLGVAVEVVGGHAPLQSAKKRGLCGYQI